jgi:hypothetical protein
MATSSGWALTRVAQVCNLFFKAPQVANLFHFLDDSGESVEAFLGCISLFRRYGNQQPRKAATLSKATDPFLNRESRFECPSILLWPPNLWIALTVEVLEVTEIDRVNNVHVGFPSCDQVHVIVNATATHALFSSQS